MTAMDLFLRRTWALTKKNLVIAIVRCPLSTFIRALLIPILLVTILLEIPNFGGGDPNTYGVGTPAPVSSLATSLSSADTGKTKPLAIVSSSDLGPDFAQAYDIFTTSLSKDQILRLDNRSAIREACNVDFRGNSDCHAVLIFTDSPSSGRPNATWNYTLMVDPGRLNGVFDVTAHVDVVEQYFYPLQLAIEEAMIQVSQSNTSSSKGNTTLKGRSTQAAQVEALAYYFRNETQEIQNHKDDFLETSLYILSFVFFISMCTMVHHVSSMMAAERQSGLSQLADAMSGGMSAARVTSYILTFDLLYLPTWLILGALYSRLLIPTSNPAVLIFWQVLTGWAVTSASVFASAFFQSEPMAATVVPAVSLILAVIAAWQENQSLTPPRADKAVGLSLFFPSSNFVFFLDFAIRAEELGLPVNLAAPLARVGKGHALQYFWQHTPIWVFDLSPIILWVLLIVQVWAYGALAVLVEHLMHGNNYRHRSFTKSQGEQQLPTSDTTAAIETTDLEKQFRRPVNWRFWRRAPPQSTAAVDGLSLRGRRNEVLCLLGPNGSGKTTTLHMLAGLIAPSGGEMRINAPKGSLGLCPQKDVLWDHLTVYEHLALWRELKGGHSDKKLQRTEKGAAVEHEEDLFALLSLCDLSLKRDNQARTLSGGMKRKLQLACMLVGGSSVCLMDEATSGLDPLSRRVIWDAVLRERARRTVIMTTHFLDECEVLSDHIVILERGKIKCQGLPAELKEKLGGGYKVFVPKDAGAEQRVARLHESNQQYLIVDEENRYVVTAPNSASAAKVLSLLDDASGVNVRATNIDDSETLVVGPTIEDVFLAVSDRKDSRDDDNDFGEPSSSALESDLDATNQTNRRRHLFLLQYRAIFIKRCLILLRSQWWLYILILGIPIAFSTSSVLGTFLQDYVVPTCSDLLAVAGDPELVKIYNAPDWLVGPGASANASLVAQANATWAQEIEQAGFLSAYPFEVGYDAAPVQNSSADFLAYLDAHSQTVSPGGIFLGNETSPTLIAANLNNYGGVIEALALLNVANVAQTGIPIAMYFGQLLSLQTYQDGTTILWISIICLLHTVWPALFALYPTYERRSQVRALQYSNGVQPIPLWLAHASFDLIFVVIISIVCTILVSSQAAFWGIGYIALTLFLYGIAAMLLSYILSLFASSQPAAAALAICVMIIEFVISSIVAITSASGATFSQATLDGTTYGLGLVFPIQNLMRAFMLGLNQFTVRCRESGAVDNPGSVLAYGGPILLLAVQIVAFAGLLLMLDGNVSLWRRSRKISVIETVTPHLGQNGDKEIDSSTRSPLPAADVEAERVRVESLVGAANADHHDKSKTSAALDEDQDHLRLLHVSKYFGTHHAVDDLTLGLRRGEILALLGPNGAGKTTTLDMIRGSLAPTAGTILLANGDSVVSNPRLAHSRMGVCPQFDALDLNLTVQQHLLVYARCKGLSQPKRAARHAMAQVGILSHAAKPASKLSGGQKRRLSLAIALLGNPPILLLDEPSTAMDAAAKRAFWAVMRRLMTRDRSVLLTTHSMEEADHLATRAAILARAGSGASVAEDKAETGQGRDTGGRLLAIGTTQDLRRRHGNEYHVQLVLNSAPFSTAQEMDRLVEWVKHACAPRHVRFEGVTLGGQVRFVVPAHLPSEQATGGSSSIAFARSLIDALEENKENLGLRCYTVGAATMESVFMSVVGKHSNGQGDAGAEERERKTPWWRRKVW